VTGRGRYLVGAALVAVAGAGVILMLPAAVRTQAAGGAAIALALQAPLGWWVLRSIGTARFQLVWTLGMLARLAMVAVTGLILVPALGWNVGPVLGALVAALLLLLLVEAVTAVGEHSSDSG
jgi:hypothetical protein